MLHFYYLPKLYEQKVTKVTFFVFTFRIVLLLLVPLCPLKEISFSPKSPFRRLGAFSEKVTKVTPKMHFYISNFFSFYQNL